MRKYVKNSSFLIGSLFILLLLIFSFIYTFYLKDIIKKPPTLLYDQNGKLLATYPYPPSLRFLFGVDRQGQDVFWLVIDGAKYTILLAMIVSFLRVLFGMLFGIIYGVYLQKFKFIFQALERAFRFVPAVLLVLLFFQVNFITPMGQGMTMLISQIILLTVVALPPLTNIIGNEVSFYSKNDFITSSKLMGGSNIWIIRRHVIPFLKSRLLLLYVQQVIQVLLLLVHLGVFHLVVGGSFSVNTIDGNSVTVSLSNEWSGLIGLSYVELMLDKWIVIGPSIGFILTILAFTLIKKGIENANLSPQKTGKKEKHSTIQLSNNTSLDFSFAFKGVKENH